MNRFSIEIFKASVLVLGLFVLAACDSGSVNNAASTTQNESNTQATSDIRGEEVSYQVGDQVFNGYIAYDAASDKKRPGIIVVHEWWGHTEYVRTRAYMLAKLGYTAIALDMYGDGKTASHPDDAQKFMMEVMNSGEQMQQRFVAGKNLLEQHPTVDPTQIAAIGYCMGGAVVLDMARSGMDLKGVASFHGSLGTSMPAHENAVTAKVLVLHGEDDPFVPPDQVDAFKKEMDAAKADYVFIAYPDAVHGFTNPGATELGNQFGLPLGYNETADTQSWERFKSFLNEIFVK